VITRKLTPGLVGYLVMIMLGVFFPLLAVLGYLVIRCVQPKLRPQLKSSPGTPSTTATHA
jgi:hypothetical protein